MCQRKPGPRCSADAKKVIVSLRKSVVLYKERETKAYLAYDRLASLSSDDFIEEFRYENWLESRSDTATVISQLEQANLDYDATPEGIESLKKNSQVAGSSVVSKTYLVRTWDNEENPLASKEVAIKIPKKDLLEDKLKLAAEHRETQSRVLKILSEAEESSLEKALFLAETLQGEAVAKATKAASKARESDMLAKASVKEFFHRDSLDHRDKAISYARTEASENINRYYLTSLATDIESYIKTSRKALSQRQNSFSI